MAFRIPGRWRGAATGRYMKGAAIALALVALFLVLLGWYWTEEPDPLEIDQLVEREAGGSQVTGVRTTVTLIGVAETLLEKRGGYLSNDVLPPGAWLDNIPNWEFGVLVQVRDFSRAMRDRFSRSQSQSSEDENLALAEPLFNFDSDSWMLPATESEYRKGIRHVRTYLERLTGRDARFYARADNLRFWLSTVESRLGSLSQRLAASVGQRRLDTEVAREMAERHAVDESADEMVKTPWLKIDDVFYEARGTTWALIQFLRAIEEDFASVLEDKNATVSLRQIIRELESTQTALWSPVVLNGGGFGVLANHSLVMASYISRANAAIIDLRDLLSQG